MPSAPRARSRFSPTQSPSCAGCAWPDNRNRTSPMTTCLPTSMNSVMNLRDALELLSQAEPVEEVLAAIELSWLQRLGHDLAGLAHPHQLPPACANGGGPWNTCLMLGGRGAGKTRLGAEFTR